MLVKSMYNITFKTVGDHIYKQRFSFPITDQILKSFIIITKGRKGIGVCKIFRDCSAVEAKYVKFLKIFQNTCSTGTYLLDSREKNGLPESSL